MTVAEYGIAVFHNLGDILSCTPVARQLKASDPGCRVTWFTSERGTCVLANNPFVDEVVGLPGDPVALDGEIPRLRAERAWKRFLTPAAYCNFDSLPGGSVFDLVRAGAGLEWFVPFAFPLRLTGTEVRQARAYWSRLPPGRKILVETRFRSDQSPWTEECAFDLVEALAHVDPVFVFTASEQPPFLERFRHAWPKAVWCHEPFRLNAEFYNLCDAFVGVSSGISALAHSEHCRRNVPHVEFSNGEQWGAAVLPAPEELFVCYSRRRYREALAAVAARLSPEPARADFTPRFPRSVRSVPCPACGCSAARPARRDEMEFVQCVGCQLIHSRRPEPVAATREVLPPEARDRRRGAFAAFLAKGVRAGAALLDVTAGHSDLPEVARTLGMRATSARPEEFIAAATPEASLDVVFATSVLQRVDHPVEFLEKLEHVLRPGGRLVCTFPNWSSLTSIALLDGWSGLDRGRSRCHFTLPMARQHFIQAGFFLDRCWTDAGEAGPAAPMAALAQLAPKAQPASFPALLTAVERKGGGEQIHVVARKRGRTKARVAR